MDIQKPYYGAAYYDEYMPVSRVEQDLELMKAAGFDLIRIAESTWSTWEPEDCEFDFTSLHRVLAAAQKHGIRVIVGTPTYAIPLWLAKKYPDILAETHNGKNLYGPRQNMDITHPEYLRHCERIIRVLCEQCRDYTCIIGYQLDNETKPYDTCSERVQRRFRRYLKEKFGSIQALNDAFGFAYWSNSVASFDELPDPRGTINGSYGAEFETFQRSLVTEFLSWQAGIVREYLKDGQFITHNFDYGWRGYSFGIQPDVNQFEAAKVVSVTGCDIYHPGGLENTGAEISFGGDLARALKKDNYLVLETQCQGNMGWLPYPGQLRLQAFHHLSCGANGVEYWHWHSIHNAIESYWKGVLSHDLTPGRAYRECATVGRDFARIGDKLVNLRKKNRVAVLVSQKSLHGFNWFPTCGGMAKPERGYNDYLRWVYDGFYRLNIEVDILDESERNFTGYDLLVVPCLYSAEDNLIWAIRDYVANGGHLIATFRSFFADENLKIRAEAQPYGMTDVFGLTYDEFTVPEHTVLPAFTSLVEDWMELLCPTSAQVLATYDNPGFRGVPAATCNRFGKGAAAYLGCYTPDGFELMLLRLLTMWHIPVPEISWPVVMKRGTNREGRNITYLLHYSPDTRVIPSPMSGTELLSGRILSEGEPVELKAWDVKILEGTK